jgi:hypothetical protein
MSGNGRPKADIAKLAEMLISFAVFDAQARNQGNTPSGAASLLFA